MSKKIILVALAVAAVLCFVGCQNEAEDSGGGSTTGDCLTFKGDKDFTLGINTTSKIPGKKSWDGTVEYSTDKTNWTVWDGTTINSAASGGSNYIYLRGKNNNHFAYSVSQQQPSATVFALGGNANEVECTGNIMTLLDYSSPDTAKMDDACFSYLFMECTKLTKAPDLPATNLSMACYCGMFAGCTSLKTAPNLPATTLSMGCYASMFMGCTSLKAVPNLSATTLSIGCYGQMFDGCSALKTTPALPVTSLTEQCYCAMFRRCTSLTSVGKIADGKTVAPIVSSSGETSFDEMFSDCENLKIGESTSGGTQFVSIGGSQDPRNMFYECKDKDGNDKAAPAAEKGKSYSFF